MWIPRLAKEKTKHAGPLRNADATSAVVPTAANIQKKQIFAMGPETADTECIQLPICTFLVSVRLLTPRWSSGTSTAITAQAVPGTIRVSHRSTRRATCTTASANTETWSAAAPRCKGASQRKVSKSSETVSGPSVAASTAVGGRDCPAPTSSPNHCRSCREFTMIPRLAK